jgi:hypothetical protein
MRTNRSLRAGCVLAICVSLSLGLHGPRAAASSPAWSAAMARPQSTTPVTDVALSPDGRLYGQVINGQGVPLASLQVAILDQVLAEVLTQSDDQGRFAFAVGRGGMYTIRAGGACAVCRVWTAGSAPPAAQGWLSLRVSETVIRGQSSPAYQWISEHPWLFYTGVAAAITVPLVIATSQRDKPASP